MTAANVQDFIDSVGVNLHLTSHPGPYYDNFDQVLPTLQDLGIRHIRDTAVFTPTTNASYYLYQRINVLGAAGIKVSLACMDPLNGYFYVPPTQITNIISWCNGYLEQIEGSNEPNLLGNPSIRPYISHEHQWALFNVAKSSPANKTLPVLSPSYIQGNVALIADHAATINDYINVHPYPGCQHPENSSSPGCLTTFISDFQTKIGLKLPAMATENGYHTALQTTSSFLPVSETIKTRYLPRMLLWAFLKGVKRTYIYQLIDSIPNDPADKESNFGLLDYKLNKKPSYSAVKNLLALTKSSGVGSQIVGLAAQVSAPCAVNQLLVQRADGSFVLFVWQGVSGWNSTSRSDIPPVSTPATITFNALPTGISASRFCDDGTLSRSTIIPAMTIPINISDQVTALEIA